MSDTGNHGDRFTVGQRGQRDDIAPIFVTAGEKEKEVFDGIYPEAG